MAGVVGDVRSEDLHEEPEPLVYVALWERAPESASVVIRALPSAPSLAAVSWLRDAVRELDPRLPVSRVQTMTDVRSESLSERRFQTVLVSVFAASALLLAALGTYSCLAYMVARRRGEIGLRMALGANPRDILAMVLRQGLAPVAAGLAFGLCAALLVARALSSLLYAVSPTDVGTFGAVSAITLAVASLACWHPARRAARIAPLRALRGDMGSAG